MLSTFVGADSAAFERQCFALGVRNRCRTLALAIDESTLERIGDFERLPTEANSALVARYRRTYGPWAPPLSTLTESVYERCTSTPRPPDGLVTTTPARSPASCGPAGSSCRVAPSR